MTRDEEQMLALSGVFTGAYAVHRLSQDGELPDSLVESMVTTLLNINPKSTLDVFGHSSNVRFGLSALSQLFSKQANLITPEVVRYGMAAIQLERRLSKNPKLLNKLSVGLEKSQSKADYFQSITHGSVISSMATNYVESVGSMNKRIHVTGRPQHLSKEGVAELVRTSLLFSIRSAMLWRQLGGHRWQLLFKRTSMQQCAQHMLRNNISE